MKALGGHNTVKQGKVEAALVYLYPEVFDLILHRTRNHPTVQAHVCLEEHSAISQI